MIFTRATASLLSAGLLVLLAACNTISSDKPRKLDTQTAALFAKHDIYADRRAAGEPAPTMTGVYRMEVQTVVGTATGSSHATSEEPFDGARCRLESDGILHDVVTPAKIDVPMYGAQSKPIRVTCNAEGYETYEGTMEAFLHPGHGGSAAMAIGGVIGALVAIAIEESSRTGGKHWRYRDTAIYLDRAK